MYDRIYTVDDVMAMGPCQPDADGNGGYPRERVKSLIGDGMTLAEGCELDIPIEDRIWIVVALLSAREQRLLAAACAESVLPIFEACHSTDERPRECVNVIRRYAEGHATEDELLRATAEAAFARDAAAAEAVAAWEVVLVWDAVLAAGAGAALVAAARASWDTDAAKAQLDWLRMRLQDGDWYAKMQINSLPANVSC